MCFRITSTDNPNKYLFLSLQIKLQILHQTSVKLINILTPTKLKTMLGKSKSIKCVAETAFYLWRVINYTISHIMNENVISHIYDIF